jgi:hypothetical protein
MCCDEDELSDGGAIGMWVMGVATTVSWWGWALDLGDFKILMILLVLNVNIKM